MYFFTIYCEVSSSPPTQSHQQIYFLTLLFNTGRFLALVEHFEQSTFCLQKITSDFLEGSLASSRCKRESLAEM